MRLSSTARDTRTTSMTTHQQSIPKEVIFLSTELVRLLLTCATIQPALKPLDWSSQCEASVRARSQHSIVQCLASCYIFSRDLYVNAVQRGGVHSAVSNNTSESSCTAANH